MRAVGCVRRTVETRQRQRGVIFDFAISYRSKSAQCLLRSTPISAPGQRLSVYFGRPLPAMQAQYEAELDGRAATERATKFCAVIVAWTVFARSVRACRPLKRRVPN